VSTFPVGYSSSAVAQHEVPIGSSLADFVEQRFDDLWRAERSLSLDDYFRLPIRLLRPQVPSPELAVDYIQSEGVVYLAGTEDGPLVSSDLDRIVVEVTGSGNHPLSSLGRCRVVPHVDRSPNGVDMFIQKYGAASTS
jgi:hypothetical protein